MSAKAVSVEDTMDAFFSLFQRLEPQLTPSFPTPTRNEYAGHSNRRLKTFLRGQRPGDAHHRCVVLLTALVFYVCRPVSSPGSANRFGYRSTGEKPASSSSSQRDSVVSWNIGRLLKPLNDV